MMNLIMAIVTILLLKYYNGNGENTFGEILLMNIMSMVTIPLGGHIQDHGIN